MKHPDTFSKFSKRLLGAGLVSMGLLLCGSLFVSSTQQATADPLPLDATGKYQMNFVTYWGEKGPVTEVLVWDTETGYSRIYYYDNGTKTLVVAGEKYQLPAKPL